MGPHVRSGSKAVITDLKCDFRSTPNNGHHQTGPIGPFGAKAELMHRGSTRSPLWRLRAA